MLVVFLYGCLGLGVRADESIYTQVQGPGCADRSRPQFSAWRCTGPGGFVAEYIDEGNRAAIRIHRGGDHSGPWPTLSWRGSGKVFGDLLEWRVEVGKPKAAILRIWRLEAMAGGADREAASLLVLKVSPRTPLPDGRNRCQSTRCKHFGQASGGARSVHVVHRVGIVDCLQMAEEDPMPTERFDYLYEGDNYRCCYSVSADKIFVSVDDMKVGAITGQMEPARVARILAHELLVQRSFGSSVSRQ
jgi:hypothetical protein